MPILDDIMNHQVIGPAIRQGLEKGMERGLQQGRQEGRQEGVREGQQEEAMKILRRLIAERFGPLPPSIADRLARMSVTELEDLSSRLLRSASLHELFENK